MPGLLRAAAATAVVAGTAQATRNAVNRHSAEKDAKAYTQAMNDAQAQQPQYYAPPPQQYAPPPPQPQYVAAPPSNEDVVSQLERLGALKAQGLLTEAEFNAQKAKLLGM